MKHKYWYAFYEKYVIEEGDSYTESAVFMNLHPIIWACKKRKACTIDIKFFHEIDKDTFNSWIGTRYYEVKK